MKTQNLNMLTEEERKAYFEIQHKIRSERKPRKPKKLPEVRSHEYCLNLFSKAKSPRDKILLELIYYCGLRVSEALNVSVDDIDFKESIVKVMKGKGNKQRLVPIPKPLMIDLKAWMSLENIIENKLFNIKRQQAFNIVKKLDHTIHPHTLRHSYATYVYGKTKDLKGVQDLLGHESMNTTSIYAHISVEDKKKMIKEVFE